MSQNGSNSVKKQTRPKMTVIEGDVRKKKKKRAKAKTAGKTGRTKAGHTGSADHKTEREADGRKAQKHK